MSILDRYLARQFLINFIILAVVLMTLYVLVDLIVDLDAFIEVGSRRAAGAGNGNGNGEGDAPWWLVLWHTGGALFEYEGPLMLMLFVTFSGLLAIAAMGFTFAALGKSHELIAMVMGGWSMYRIAAPVITVAAVLIAVALPIQEFVLPRLAERLTRSKGDLKYERGPTIQITLMDDGEGNLFSAARFDSRVGLLDDVTILQRDAQGRLLRRITAQRALWEPDREGWLLESAKVETPDVRTGLANSPANAGQANAPSPPDQPPGEASAENLPAAQDVIFPTTMSPSVLLAARHAMYARLLSARQLTTLASNDALDAWEIQTILHGRLSYVVVNILLVVMAIRFFLTREPVNMMVQGIRATCLLLPAWLMAMLLVTVGVSFLNPVASAWLAVVILLPLAAGVLQTVRT